VFASEKLTWLREGEQLSYLLPKSLPDGCQVLHLTPLELLEKMRADTAREAALGYKLSKFIHMDVMYAGFASLQGCNLLEQCRSNCRGAKICCSAPSRSMKTWYFGVETTQSDQNLNNSGEAWPG